MTYVVATVKTCVVAVSAVAPMTCVMGEEDQGLPASCVRAKRRYRQLVAELRSDGLSQAKVAQKLGTQQRVISDVEHDHLDRVGWKVIESAAERLQLSRDFFYRKAEPHHHEAYRDRDSPTISTPWRQAVDEWLSENPELSEQFKRALYDPARYAAPPTHAIASLCSALRDAASQRAESGPRTAPKRRRSRRKD